MNSVKIYEHNGLTIRPHLDAMADLAYITIANSSTHVNVSLEQLKELDVMIQAVKTDYAKS